jgi:hypothetical protein
MKQTRAAAKQIGRAGKKQAATKQAPRGHAPEKQAATKQAPKGHAPEKQAATKSNPTRSTKSAKSAKSAKSTTTKPSKPTKSTTTKSTKRATTNELAAKPLAKGSLERHSAVLRALRRHGLAFPEAHTKSPWPGHLDLAVRDKTFAYLSLEGDPLTVSCKLPVSRDEAMSLPFTSPTEYGLGKSGWVTATFAEDDDPPLEFLRLWLEESYRAQAPKKLAKLLDPVE